MLACLAALQVTLATPAPGPVDSLLATLTLEQKVGQLIMPWLPGSYAAADADPVSRALGWIDSLEVGGIIVSIGSPLDIAAKVNVLQRRSRLPLMIAADLEAGTATRVVGGTGFPTNMGVAATGRVADAYEQGRITAVEARAVGIMLTFSPVADVNSNPANPIINTRSYGEDPHRVAALVRAYVRGAEEHGLRTTAKHFPGHGDTDTDSHIELPVLRKGYTTLELIELVPFRAAISAGVTGIMTAHIAVPAFDGGRGLPATFSHNILNGLLTDSLAFDGLVVTDGLQMGAIVRSFAGGEAGVQALLAGSDVLLQPSDPRVVFDAVVEAVRGGRITEERLDRSVRKLLVLKQQADLFGQRTVDLERVTEIVGRMEHLAVAEDIAQRAVTLVRDRGSALGVIAARRAEVAVVGYGPETVDRVGSEMAAELREGGGRVRYFRLWPSSGTASFDSARAVIRGAGAVVFAPALVVRTGQSEIAVPDSLVSLIAQTAAAHPTVVVSLGTPYLHAQLPPTASYLIAWQPSRIAERAAAKALQGRAAIGGRLPISLPPDYPSLHGLDRPARR